MLALAENHELVFYDQRGGGKSRTDDPTPITWQTHVEDLAAVANELAFDRPGIIGYSWGGLLAMLYSIAARGSIADPRFRVPGLAESPVPSPQSLILLDPAPITRKHRQ